ncbi:MAG: hypothetical protein JW883_06220, partial [Deltaproteobacteria bacterium]|nr:hypothetical protein [Deltaproteobacteria bacterium]
PYLDPLSQFFVAWTSGHDKVPFCFAFYQPDDNFNTTTLHGLFLPSKIMPIVVLVAETCARESIATDPMVQIRFAHNPG